MKNAPSPITPLLETLQRSIGWHQRIDDNLKDRIVGRLARLLDDDQLSAGEHIGVVGAFTKLQAVENQALGLLVTLHGQEVLAKRLAEIEAQLAPAEDDGPMVIDVTDF